MIPRLAGEIGLLFRRSLAAAYSDGCFGTAKGAAYSSLLSFFPVLTTLATILVQANAESVARVLLRFLFEVVPPGSEDLVRHSFAIRGARPAGLLVGATLLSLWAASGVMSSLMEGFQAAYRTPDPRSFWRKRSVAVLLVFLAALPALAASVLILLGGRVEQRVMIWLGFLPSGEQLRGGLAFATRAAGYAVALAAVILVTMLLYQFGPHCAHRSRRVWPGAIVATAMWLAVTSGFAWYVRNIANYNVLYGSVGAVIALLVWMYVLAVIALIGCEFNAEGERAKAAGERLLLF